MNYRKTFKGIILIAWSTIAVIFFMCSITLNNAQAEFLFKVRIDFDAGNRPYSIAIGDFNRDDDPDLAVANEGSSGNVSVLLGNGDGSFEAAVNHAAGDDPRSVAIGDLNGDDHPDLAVANHGSNNVSVLLGNGDGSFQSAVNYGAGLNPHSVAIGDLNGDGALDLSLANLGSDYVSVLLGNGDGSFQSAVNYGANVNPSSVAIGDLNGDGGPDLAVANEGSGNVSVLLGNGDGTFQSAVNYGAGNMPFSVAIGDLNGDGDLDLAVADRASDNVSVLLGNGDGSFQSAVNYIVGGSTYSVAIGDLNGDGNRDLAVAIEGSGNVSVLLGNGDGSFQSAVNYVVGGFPHSVAIGDLNGDDNLDMAVANLGSVNVSVLLGNGDGSFEDAVNYSAGIHPRSVAIGDLNGDDHPDLAVANSGSNNVSVLLGNGDGSFQSAVNYGAGVMPWYIAIGNLDGDDNLDLAVANRGSNNVSFLINTGGVAKLLYTPVTPCRIVDTRKTSAGIIDANTQRNFRVFGPVGVQGGNSSGCSAPMGEPLAAHINMVAVAPKGKGNLQAFPLGAGPGAGLIVNYNAIDTNLANAGTVKSVSGGGPDITVTSRVSSVHAVIDVLGYYYYPAGELMYNAVTPCRIVDTRNAGGIIDAGDERDFHVYGSGGTISGQGGTAAGCSSPLGEPLAAHINVVAVDPTGKGNLQAFPLGAGPGAGLIVNYNAIDTNLANAGTVKSVTGGGPDITVTSRVSSVHAVIDVLGYYYPAGELMYKAVTPCRIVDTRNGPGIVDPVDERNFYVYGSGGSISAQGGTSAGCPSPLGEPLAAHINLVAVDPTGKGNLQAFPLGAGPGAGLIVNYNAIDTNLANAGTVKSVSGGGPDITVTSRVSSVHAVIDVLGYYYPAP
jgi:hypothetical protein